MARTKLYALTEAGQEVWHDDLYRELVISGRLQKMIDDDGLSGLTSNPTIFENAFRNDPVYVSDIEKLVSSGKSIDEIYNTLIFTDIKMAARAFEDLYKRSSGELGHVCLEVSPLLAYKPEETVEEVKKIVAQVGVDNLMIKVPGTEEGVAAIRKLVEEGYKINVTLLFSVDHYRKVARAYIEGLKERASKRLPLKEVRGVASVFLSRIDTSVDSRIEEIIQSDRATSGSKKLAENLLGKAAIAVGKLIFKEYRKIFGTNEFYELEDKGANLQKVLWASTGTKNLAYSDVKYVENFIFPDTVVTMPTQTMEAFRDHGNAKIADEDYDEQEGVLSDLLKLGIDINRVCDELQDKGAQLFTDSYLNIRAQIEKELMKAKRSG